MCKWQKGLLYAQKKFRLVNNKNSNENWLLEINFFFTDSLYFELLFSSDEIEIIAKDTKWAEAAKKFCFGGILSNGRQGIFISIDGVACVVVIESRFQLLFYYLAFQFFSPRSSIRFKVREEFIFKLQRCITIRTSSVFRSPSIFFSCSKFVISFPWYIKQTHKEC